MKNFVYWYDGNLISGRTLEIAIDDPGLLYGATVFTTLRVYQSLDHPLTHWQGHCSRLHTSLEALHWQPPNWQRLRQGAELLTQFPVLRIVVFPDGREWITGRFLPSDLSQRQQQGITAWVIEEPDLAQRSLPAHKTGNYLASWLSLQAAHRSSAQEAILTDQDGNWLETSTGNLWGWCDNHWWTPPLSAGILPGLLRSQLIAKFKCQNEEVIEEAWTADRVETFEAIAYTNCVVEVVPIHTILRDSTQRIYPSVHPGFQKLRGLFIS